MDKLSFFADDLVDYDELMELSEEGDSLVTATADIPASSTSPVSVPLPAPAASDSSAAGNNPDVAVGPLLPPAVSPGLAVEPQPSRDRSGLDRQTVRETYIRQCRVCQSRHPLRFCRQFLDMSHETRLRTVVMYRYCSRCLAQSHQARSCPSGKKCAECGEDHNTLLHAERKKAASAERPSRASRRRSRSSRRRLGRASDARRPSEEGSGPLPFPIGLGAALPLQHVVALAPSLVVQVRSPGVMVPVRAVLDPCGKQSQICASMVERLRLPASCVDGVRLCRFTVTSAYDPAQCLTLTARVCDLSHVSTPTESVPERIKDSFLGFPLADPQFYRVGRVALVFGPEVYAKIVTSQIQANPGLPVAHYTIFGWVLSGICNC